MSAYGEGKFRELNTGRKIGRLIGYVIVGLLALTFLAGFFEIGLIFTGH